jgi:hypothetical protein
VVPNPIMRVNTVTSHMIIIGVRLYQRSLDDRVSFSPFGDCVGVDIFATFTNQRFKPSNHFKVNSVGINEFKGFDESL